MVDIPVDNGNALDAPNPLRMARSHGNGIEQAEPHGSVTLGVMSRRPHRTEGCVNVATRHGIDRLDCRPRRPRRSFIRCSYGEGVAFIQHSAAALAGAPHAINVLTRMHEGQNIIGGGLHGRLHAAMRHAALRQPIENCAKPGGLFDMARRRGVQETAGGRDQGKRAGSHTVLRR